MTDYASAAVARAAGVAASADRPAQRRCAEDAASRPVLRVAVRGLELRGKDSAPDVLSFRGYASVTETPYEMYDMFGPYTEVVSADAFTETLAQSDLDVPFVLGHDQMRRIARTTNGTLRLSQDENGLLVDADLDPADPDVAYIAPKLRAGLIDEMSFAFRIESGQWSPDYSEFRINRVDMHRGDVAIVGYGANPHTTGSGLRAATPTVSRVLVVSDDDVRGYQPLI